MNNDLYKVGGTYDIKCYNCAYHVLVTEINNKGFMGDFKLSITDNTWCKNGTFEYPIFIKEYFKEQQINTFPLY